MNTPPTAPRELDSFESALLTELRAHVADRPVPDTVTEPTRSRPHYRRWAAGLAVAAAAATAFVVGSAGGPATSPAYAVAQEADGDVVVTIHRLEDSEGLEAALHEKGIDAEVSFEEWPPGVSHEFSDGDHMFRFWGPGVTPVPNPTLPGNEPDAPACGLEAGDPATLTQEGDSWVLRIPASSPLQDRPVSITAGVGGALGVRYEDNDLSCGWVGVTD
ncbi:MAG TPA: hypothetical protein VNQ53_11820 [Nocardioides sp.]|nr:hypothetical protein [Nocardioides sp.]